MSPVIGMLLQVILGLWVAAGFADWWCHRRTRIEQTSGTAEALCHWLLLLQMGTAITLCTLFQPTLLLLVLLLCLWLAHQSITFMELRWVCPVRDVTPGEQMIHSFLEVLPVAGMLLLSIPVVDSALQEDSAAAAWTLERRALADVAWRAEAWPALIFACVAFNGLPYLEELWRCLRWHRSAAAATVPGPEESGG